MFEETKVQATEIKIDDVPLEPVIEQVEQKEQDQDAKVEIKEDAIQVESQVDKVLEVENVPEVEQVPVVENVPEVEMVPVVEQVPEEPE